MREIEAGEYIRTRSGIIDKVDIDYYGICNSPNCNCKHVSCQYDYYDEEDIVKHSKNIIDLIEVKDIIRVHNLKGDIFDFTIEIFDDKTMIDLQLALDNNELKLLSILTHEQYEKNCCKMEEIICAK